MCSEEVVDVFDQTPDLLLSQLIYPSDVFGCCVSHSAIRFLISSAKIGKSLVENYCLHILYI